jgi:hypothetical protein
MPSFRIPITRRIADPDPDGPIRAILQAAIAVEVRTRQGLFHTISRCVVDTGASYTMMSTARAEAIGLEVPAATSRAPLLTASQSRAATVRDGEIRLRFVQLPGRIFRLYCLFIDDLPETTPLLFGLNDFLDTFRIAFDGRYTREAPAGHMLFETI